MTALTCYLAMVLMLFGASVMAYWRQAGRSPFAPAPRPKRKPAPRWWLLLPPLTWGVTVPLATALIVWRGLGWGVPLLLGALSVSLMHAHLDGTPLVGEGRKRKPKPTADGATRPTTTTATPPRPKATW